jgi:hypothetical protein
VIASASGRFTGHALASRVLGLSLRRCALELPAPAAKQRVHRRGADDRPLEGELAA